MTKQRKPAMSNKIVLEKLKTAGYTIQDDTKLKKCDEFSTNFSNTTIGSWDYNQRCRVYDYEKVYMIPIDTFRTHVNKRFKEQFKVGSMVRVRQKTKRQRQRNKYNQAIGDSQDFKHLGIGSGKEYHSEEMKDVVDHVYNNFSYTRYNNSWRVVNSKILIGNTKYCPNLFASINQLKAYKHAGKTKKHHWYPNKREDYSIRDFMEFIPITPAGVLGPKQLFNGYITQAYVHFIYPRWDKKREARYEITFETGARGIFTNDYIDRVYDTDIEVDEKLMDGCPNSSICTTNCDHRDVHLFDDECNIECFNDLHHVCTPIYDYTELFNTTHGMALELDKED
jgi:hypothetical protein